MWVQDGRQSPRYAIRQNCSIGTDGGNCDLCALNDQVIARGIEQRLLVKTLEAVGNTVQQNCIALKLMQSPAAISGPAPKSCWECKARSCATHGDVTAIDGLMALRPKKPFRFSGQSSGQLTAVNDPRARSCIWFQLQPA